MALSRKLTSKIYEIKAHTVKVTSLDLGETGRVLVTGGKDRNVNLWAIGEEKCFMSLPGHNGGIDCVKFAYNDDFVYSADDIGIIRRWDLNAQTSSTLNGHMKTVKTLDFNPSGSTEYVVSGSNDTTVRLWDVRNQNRCIKTYRGHIANVNSVKFSPDGLWIASAGTEGSVIIWDIRKSKQIMQFTERASPITCIQFHPFEFLLAAGRNDGSVYIYDLEKNELISKHECTNPYTGQTVKCITFSESGECLFVGTASGISVIGWEPDREFDHIESNWSFLGDMKIVNNRMILGSYERENVAVHTLNINRVFPFYNPVTQKSQEQPQPFSHNQTTRRSFTRGTQKLRLSINSSVKKTQIDRLQEEDIENAPSDGGGSSNGGNSSPNLSIELVDDIEEPTEPQNLSPFDAYAKKLNPSSYNFPSLSSTSSRSSGLAHADFGSSPGSISINTLNSYSDGPSSLKTPGERDINKFDKVVSSYENNISFGPIVHTDELSEDLGGVKINIEANGSFSLNDSSPIISNYDEAEMEHFVVNNAQLPDYAPGQVNFNPPPPSAALHKTALNTQHKTKGNPARKTISSGLPVSSRQNGSPASSTNTLRRIGSMQSISSMELHKMDDNTILSTKRQNCTIRSRREIISASNVNNHNNNLYTQSKDNNAVRTSKHIPVQIMTKQPPPRSKTSFDLRTSSSATNLHSSASKICNYQGNYTIDDTNEIHSLMQYHDKIYYELKNRYATLQSIRDSTREADVVGALKKAIKISGRTIFVDLLGAILEKTSTWNLDLCLLLLPEIYELIQSQHKFHHTRACDTLRVILKNFLPIIEENCSSWGGSAIGVDITREERQRKCMECHTWLLRIRNLPSDSQHVGSTLAQLQNMITL